VFSFLRIWAAFLRRDILNMASYRLSFVMTWASLLFYLLIFFFVGKVFSGLGSTYLARYGGDYFPFVVVGLAMQSLVGAGLSGFSQVIASEQYLGTLEPMLTATGAFRVLAGASLSRYILSSGRLVAYLVVGALLFGASFRWAGVPLVAAAAVLTAAAYFGLGMFAAAFLLAFKQGNPVNLFFGQLGVILSGVFFPLEVLPSWLRRASALIPLTHGLELARGALLGGVAPGAAARSLGILAAFAGVFLLVGGVSFRWALRRARRDGSLGQY